MKKTEVLWDSLGIRYNLVRELSDARIYAVRPIAEQIQLIAYVVRDGQPLDVVMAEGIAAARSFGIIPPTAR